jgi:hypothetical protein
MALRDSMDDGSAPSVVERVKAMSLEELQQHLARGGRETVIAAGADGKPLLRRRRQRATIGGHADKTRTLTLGQVLAAAGAVPLALAALFLLWWRPHLYLFGGSVAWGLLWGVLLAFIYFRNARHKDQHRQLVRRRGGCWAWWCRAACGASSAWLGRGAGAAEAARPPSLARQRRRQRRPPLPPPAQLSQDPGLKGCQYLLGDVPSWINLTDREKMEVGFKGSDSALCWGQQPRGLLAGASRTAHRAARALRLCRSSFSKPAAARPARAPSSGSTSCCMRCGRTTTAASARW